MKKLLLFLTVAFFCLQVQAQKLELSVQAGSGLAAYTGSGATNYSEFDRGDTPGDSQTSNPYGKKYAFGYYAGLQAQLVNKAGLIFGLSSNYELVRSKVTNTITPYTIILFTSSVYLTPPADSQISGTSYLNNQFINLSPYVGYRLKLKKASLDILPGADIALPVSSKEKGKSTELDVTYTSNSKLTGQPTDVRIKLNIAVNYRQLCFNAGYARGLTNYYKDYHPDFAGSQDLKIHSSIFRLGLGYRLL